MFSIEARQQVELASLIGLGSAWALNVRDQLRDIRPACVDIGSLVDAGQECTAPV
jgi:hypothetical protein